MIAQEEGNHDAASCPNPSEREIPREKDCTFVYPSTARTILCDREVYFICSGVSHGRRGRYAFERAKLQVGWRLIGVATQRPAYRRVALLAEKAMARVSGDGPSHRHRVQFRFRRVSRDLDRLCGLQHARNRYRSHAVT